MKKLLLALIVTAIATPAFAGSLTAYSEAIGEGFQRRVDYFMKKAGIAIIGEDGGTACHADRVVFAASILDGTADVKQFAIGVATNATVAAGLENGHATVTDNDLEFTVNSMINDYAGCDQ